MSATSEAARGHRKQKPLATAEVLWSRVARLREEHGQSLVEFALTLPLLLLVVTGLMTFGLAINNYLLLTDSTNIGARQLAISRGSTTDPCALVVSAVTSAAPLLKSASLTFNITLNGTSYSGVRSCSSSTTTSGAAGNLVQGSTATVNVTYPCSLKIYNMNSFPSCTLTAQTAEQVQ